jgi:VIT1/CCC1 family predicted Fe2+/Mn2+ transporter
VDIVAGLVDGILTALTLSAGRLLEPGGISVALAVRVGAAAGLTTVFVFFLAHYAEMRAELVHAEKQLSLAAHGRLVAGTLGRQIFRESLGGACIAAACSLGGATLPLLLSALTPGPWWVGVALTLVILGVLGALLASSLYGSRRLWAIALVAGGIALTAIGERLKIMG